VWIEDPKGVQIALGRSPSRSPAAPRLAVLVGRLASSRSLSAADVCVRTTHRWTRWIFTRHDVRVAVSISNLVERFYGELWNKWNDPAIEDTLDPAFAFRGSLRQESLGRDEWRRYRDLVRAGSADFRNEIVELVCDGQRAVARLQYTGTHTGVLLGLPATQRRFEYAGAAFFAADFRLLTAPGCLATSTGSDASSART